MLKLFTYVTFSFLVTLCFGQTNVYDCYINNIIPIQQLENLPYEIQKNCILFPSTIQYDFLNPVVKKITSTNRILIESGFHFHPTQNNEELWLNINKCNNLTNVVCFTHNSLDSVEALKKIEFGIELPDSIEQRIQQFILSGDTLASEINPYLSWQLDSKAVFTNMQTGLVKTIHGFYFQDFKRDTSNVNKNLWTWSPISTSHHMRFRFTPEEIGVWEVLIKVKLKNNINYAFCPFTINVTENTSDDGFVKVATNKKVLVRNEKLFFPIGTHIPWPDDSHLYGNNSAYRNTHTSSYPNVELQARMGNLKSEGVDYFRLILNPPSLDLEFEEVGNYTNRLNDGWEIDQIIERAEELNMYIDFNMFVGYTLDIKSIYTRFGWDWGGDSILYDYPRSQGSFAYRERFNLPEKEAKQWFTNEDCKKYYKQKVKYLISRYGYSTHISMFELFSEINLAGLEAEVVYVNTDPNNLQVQMNIISNPYDNDPQQPLNVTNWHSEMAKFIKNELGHTEHLLAVSYAGLPNDNDSSYAIPEIDVMTFNSYSDNLGNRYDSEKINIQEQFEKYHKPMILGETGPIAEYNCDATSSFRKSAWMHAFTGAAGYNMWEAQFNSDVWHHLADVRSFIEDTPEVADLFMGNWETSYLNDNNNIGAAIRKEATYLKGTYINQLGNQENLMVGAVSNLTDNYFTNRPPDDSLNPSWCFTNGTGVLTQDQQSKQDLYPGNGVLYSSFFNLSDFTLNWFNYDGDFLSTTYSPLTSVLLLNHPLSCITGNCAARTSEIPFIIDWELSDYNKNLQNNSNPNERIIPTEGNFTPKNRVKNQLLVFPNPAQNNVQVICTDPAIITFKLVDARGKTVRVIDLRELNKSINIANLESGIRSCVNTSLFQKFHFFLLY